MERGLDGSCGFLNLASVMKPYQPIPLMVGLSNHERLTLRLAQGERVLARSSTYAKLKSPAGAGLMPRPAGVR